MNSDESDARLIHCRAEFSVFIIFKQGTAVSFTQVVVRKLDFSTQLSEDRVGQLYFRPSRTAHLLFNNNVGHIDGSLVGLTSRAKAGISARRAKRILPKGVSGVNALIFFTHNKEVSVEEGRNNPKKKERNGKEQSKRSSPGPKTGEDCCRVCCFPRI